MIKRYHQFLLESIEINEIRDYFSDLIDSGFGIDIIDNIYYDTTYQHLSKEYGITMVDFDRHESYQLMFSGSKYREGIIIKLLVSGGATFEDVTIDFQNSISQLDSIGFNLLKIRAISDNGNGWDDLNVNHISMKDSSIVLEGMNFEYNQCVLELQFYIDDEKKFNDIDVARYYGWTGYEKDESGNISIKLETSDVISTFGYKSEYYQILLEYEDIFDRYRNHGNYVPQVKEFGQRYFGIDKENMIKLLTYIIDSSNWNVFLDKYVENEELKTLSKDNFLIEITSYKQERNLCSVLENCNADYSDIISDIRWIIGDFASDAHAGKNLKEIQNSFDDMLSKHCSYTVDGEDMKIRFSNDWIRDVQMYILNESLESIFSNWVTEEIPRSEKDLKPRLSDWGDIDKKELNIEISGIVDNYKRKITS